MPIVTEKPPASTTRSKLIPHLEEVTLTIIEAKIEEDQYADADADGTQPEKLVLTWELQAEDITRKQAKRGVEAGKRIWQRLALFYYIKDDGMPTQFKAALDALNGRENGDGVVFTLDDPEAVYNDPEMLVGIKAPCIVEQYTKKKGANKGQLDNRISGIKPLDEDEDEDEALAPPPPARAPRPAPPATPVRAPARNVPQPVADSEDLWDENDKAA